MRIATSEMLVATRVQVQPGEQCKRGFVALQQRVVGIGSKRANERTLEYENQKT